MKYKAIVDELLRIGRNDLSTWSKEEFVTVCMDDYGVCKKTAEKIYQEYHYILDMRYGKTV